MILAFGIALCGFVIRNSASICTQDSAVAATIDIFRISIDLDNRLGDLNAGRRRFNAKDLQAYFEGRLSTEHSRFREIESIDFPEPRDDWGNPFVAVEHVTDEDGQVLPIGIYSNGRDGVSLTNGNDPDDLATWRKTPNAFYLNEQAAAVFWYALVMITIHTTLLFAVFFGIAHALSPLWMASSSSASSMKLDERGMQ
ncbi:MAG: hypothetical protein QM811_23515 [Pirellulales bacterium]